MFNNMYEDLGCIMGKYCMRLIGDEFNIGEDIYEEYYPRRNHPDYDVRGSRNSYNININRDYKYTTESFLEGLLDYKNWNCIITTRVKQCKNTMYLRCINFIEFDTY